jgi:tetratricopeptide (TPR) repeat protein
LLGAAVLAVYSQALHCTFVYLDDPDYVTQNPDIQHGVNWQSIHWAFTTNHGANWHPVTWLSHMLDWQLYGPDALGHHLTNLLLHLANSLLLFLLLARMTDALWRSAFVAAIFALHPLRVESVLWVAERKDVLSTFFWMLTVWAWLRYVENLKSRGSNFKCFYGLSLVFYALGLMSKPMLVTLPFALLLLDFWPLRRLALVEKIPFFALAAASSAVTFILQYRAGVVATLSSVPMGERLAGIPIAYVRYLEKIFWPSGLAVFYGLERWSFFPVAAATLFLVLMTAGVVWQARTRPFLAVGWFWFLGMLVPTIGLVQVGHQSMADRYSYLPSVGISIMVAWGLCEVLARRPLLLNAAAAAAVLAVAACAVLTPRQINYWKDPVALFARAADMSNQDSLTCYNVGCDSLARGHFARASRCFERALNVADKSIAPSFLAQVRNNLGCAQLELGRVAGAISNFQTALVLGPSNPQACYNLGRAYLTNHQPAAAVDSLQHALTLDTNAAIFAALADAYAEGGRFPDAAAAAHLGRQLALTRNNIALAARLESLERKYQAGNGNPPQ